MVELPVELGAEPADIAEAEIVVARISGPGSVAAALAHDLAEGVGGRDVVLTASGDVGHMAAEYWATTMRAAGVVVREIAGGTGNDVARVHLHGEVRGTGAYSPGALDSLDGPDGPVSGSLVGEVISQGNSPAARYASLAAVAEALAAVLGPAPQSH